MQSKIENPRPEKGWIRAVREAADISAGELGRILGVSRQLPLQFEKAEIEDSITLKSLRRCADALDCDLVYALVPRTGVRRDHAPAGRTLTGLGTRSRMRPAQRGQPVRRSLLLGARTRARISAIESAPALAKIW
jgi:transcriptional regulator with XRE-family HTH domain